MRVFICTTASVLCALLYVSQSYAQHSRLLPLRPLETFHGLSADQLEEVANYSKQNPARVKALVTLTRCVETTLAPKAYDALLQFGQSAKHNIREDCFQNERDKAARFAKEQVSAFSRTELFESMSSCLKTQEDLDVLTEFVLAQMGMTPSRGDASHVCDTYDSRARR